LVRDKTDVAVQVRSRLVVSNVESACDTACAGIGITPRILLPRHGHLAGHDAHDLARRIPATAIAGSHSLPVELRAFLDFSASRPKTRLRDGR
jgi:hypothetical protein